MKVAIIGSGIAGISSALNLLNLKDDFDLKDIYVDIFEATDKVGGRVYSFKDAKSQEIIDNGKHLMIGAYTNLFSLLNKLRSFENLQFQKYLQVHLINNFKVSKFQNGIFGKFSQLNSLLKFNGLSIQEKVNLIKFTAKINHIKISQSSTLELLLDNNQSNNVIKQFWEPIVLATMNLPIHIASASLFIEILKKSFFADKNSQKLVFSKIPLMQLFDGIKQVEHPNFNLHLETKIDGIIVTEKNKYELIKKDKSLGIYDGVILSIPPKMAYKLIKTNQQLVSKLNEIQINFFEQVEYSPIISIYLWTENDFLTQDFYGLIDTEFHWIFKEKKSNPYRYTLTKSAAENLIKLSKEEIIELAYDDLSRNFTEFDRKKVIHHNIIFEKQATIKITENIQNMRPSQKLINGFYLAGDWTQTYLPATMESAAYSGRLAVQELKKDYLDF